MPWDQKGVFKQMLATDFKLSTWVIVETGWKLSMDMHSLSNLYSSSTLFPFTLLQVGLANDLKSEYY